MLFQITAGTVLIVFPNSAISLRWPIFGAQHIALFVNACKRVLRLRQHFQFQPQLEDGHSDVTSLSRLAAGFKQGDQIFDQDDCPHLIKKQLRQGTFRRR